jgi:hypothetical protein
MAAMTNLLVKDDTTSAVVEYTFIPVTDTPRPFWRTAIAGVPLQGQMRLYVSSEDLKSGETKVSMALEVPVMETLGASGTSAGYVAPPKVAYTNKFYATAIVDPRSTSADRANLLKMACGLLSGASSTTATGVLDQSSAADAWKNSTLPVTLSFTSVIIPN